MILESHEKYCVIRYPEEGWAEIDAPAMAYKYWEGPIDKLETALPVILKRFRISEEEENK